MTIRKTRAQKKMTTEERVLGFRTVAGGSHMNEEDPSSDDLLTDEELEEGSLRITIGELRVTISEELTSRRQISKT